MDCGLHCSLAEWKKQKSWPLARRVENLTRDDGRNFATMKGWKEQRLSLSEVVNRILITNWVFTRNLLFSFLLHETHTTSFHSTAAVVKCHSQKHTTNLELTLTCRNVVLRPVKITCLTFSLASVSDSIKACQNCVQYFFSPKSTLHAAVQSIK